MEKKMRYAHIWFFVVIILNILDRLGYKFLKNHYYANITMVFKVDLTHILHKNYQFHFYMYHLLELFTSPYIAPFNFLKEIQFLTICNWKE